MGSHSQVEGQNWNLNPDPCNSGTSVPSDLTQPMIALLCPLKYMCASRTLCVWAGCPAHIDAEVFVGRRKGTSRGKEERVGQRLF